MKWSQFLAETKRFIELSDSAGDGWECHGDVDTENSVYLKKTVYDRYLFNSSDTQGIEAPEDRVIRTEYNVFFSVSYGMPVLSFNIWDSGGKLLNLNEVWEISKSRFNLQENMFSVITQQEHPILFQPYFVIHPCKTYEIVEAFSEKSANILVTILSTIGPLIGLNFDDYYCKN